MITTHKLRSLEWLVEELDTNLSLATDALQAYQTDTEDRSQLSLAQAYLHQVSGSLTMAQCYGAVLLVREVEAVFNMLLVETAVSPVDTLDTLGPAVASLPRYIRAVLDGRDDTLAPLIQSVNELRALRSKPLLSSTALFMPDMAVVEQKISSVAGQQISLSRAQQEAFKKLQAAYQYALLSYVKNRQQETSQNKITAVFSRLQTVFSGTPLEVLWRVASAFFGGLVDASISQSRAVQSLLWDLDKTLRELSRADKIDLSQALPSDLLKNLLYYLARVEDSAPAITAIKTEFALVQSLPALVFAERNGSLITQFDGAVVQTLSHALRAEVATIKTLVEGFDGGDGDAIGAQIKTEIEMTAATLMMAGQMSLSQSLLELGRVVAQVLLSAEPDMAVLSARWQSIEDALRAWAVNYTEAPVAADILAETAYVVDDAQRSLIREVRNNFESIKESIVGYIASQWDSKFLEDIPQQFEHIFGAVEVIGLKRVAVIVEQLSNYISAHLLHAEQAPEWSALDTLADAITGFEYYLEAIDKGRNIEQVDMLQVTARAMEKLGFDIDPSLEETLVAEEESLPGESIDAVAAIDLDTGADDEANEDEIDPEIREIFVEEVGEVLAELAIIYPNWRANQSDLQILNDIRRGFHTLKGSGRMVNAYAISEVAWAIESMLNKIVDGQRSSLPETQALLDLSLEIIPSLVDDFERGELRLSPYCESLIAAANAAAKGEFVFIPEQGEQENQRVQQATGAEESALPAAAEREVSPIVTIFVGEARAYINTLDNFFAAFPQPSEALCVVPADVQLALHTLKASAGMSGFIALPELVHSLEAYLFLLFAHRAPIDRSIVALLAQSVEHLRDTLDGLEAGGDEDKVRLDNYRSSIELARSEWLASNLNKGQPVNFTPLQQLMATGLENVLVANTLFEQWADEGLSPLQNIAAFVAELSELGEAADRSVLPALSMLCYEFSQAVNGLSRLEVPLDAQKVHVLKTAHERLLNMMDLIAMGQMAAPVLDDLIGQLQAFAVEPVQAVAPDAVVAAEPDMQRADQDTGYGDVVSPVAGSKWDAAMPPFFIEEANELLEELENTLQAWRNEPADISQGEKINQLLHALKGNSKLMGLPLIGDLIHQFESLIQEESRHLVGREAEIFGTWFARHDQLVSILDMLRSGDPALPVDDLRAELPDEGSAPQRDGSLQAEPEYDLPTEDASATSDVEELKQVGGNDLAARMAGENHEPEILPFFLEEATELLEEVENAMQAWRDDPVDLRQGEKLNRVLHTLKGGARIAGMTLMGDLSHDLESLILQEEQKLAGREAEVFNVLFARYDELATILEIVKSGGVVGARELPRWETVEPVESVSAVELASQAEPEAEVNEGPLYLVKAEELHPAAGTAIEAAVLPSFEPLSSESALPTASALKQSRAVEFQESIKIPAQVLDKLVNLAGETSIARGRVEQGVSESIHALDEMEETITRLRYQLRQLTRQAEAQVQFRREQIEAADSADFDPLELDRYSQLQQLSRGLEESGSDLKDLKDTLLVKSKKVESLLLMQSRITVDLQENLMMTRMVPFSRLVPRLRRIVRQVSQELGKQVKLGLHNIEGEMDRTVLEKIITPIEHMLRNAIDHGIEASADRLARGKPVEGTISLSFKREGGEIVIEVADDGKGLDVRVIRERAISKKIISPDTRASDQELLRLIFQPGFSTAATLSQVSGRGVGMDVVRTEIHQLGGSISIDSTLGQGVVFTIRLPFTVSVNRALLIRGSEEDVYALPLTSIVGVTQLSAEEIEAFYRDSSKRLDHGGLEYQVCPLGVLLHGAKAASPNIGAGKASLIFVESESYRYAIHVDAIEGNQEIIVKGLGSQFNHVPGVSGATILANGKVVVILDLPSLVRSMGDKSILGDSGERSDLLRASSHSHSVTTELTKKTIMVVDDSVTVRKVTSRFLEREGFKVVTAKDGVEATDILAEVNPDLMLLDIEMPRMDGFEVARVVRDSAEFSRLPIIMISSRTGEKHTQRAKSLGVNQFIGKPYQEDELLAALDKWLDLA